MFGMRFGHAGKPVAIVDIGAGSIGCGIVFVREGEPSLLVAASRAFLSPEVRTNDQLIAGLATLLKDTGAVMMKSYVAGPAKKYGAPHELYCIVRSPWTTSQTLTDAVRYDKPTHITDAVISELAKKALATAVPAPGALFEANVARVELNGYPTMKPAGKTASHASVGVLSSTVDQDLKSATETALQTVFSNQKPKWRSHTRAALSVLGELPEDHRNCVLVDVSNEGIGILTIRKNLVDKQGTTAEGIRGILARLAPGKPEEETLALVRMLGKDACNGPACDAISAAMGAAEPGIVKMVGEVFATLSVPRKVPNRLVLLAHADFTDWISKIFSRIDFAPFTVTSKPFDIKTLGARDLGHWIIPDADVVEDAALSLAGALVHIESQDS